MNPSMDSVQAKDRSLIVLLLQACENSHYTEQPLSVKPPQQTIVIVRVLPMPWAIGQ